MDVKTARQNFDKAYAEVQLARIYHNGSLAAKQRKLNRAMVELLKAETQAKSKWIKETA